MLAKTVVSELLTSQAPLYHGQTNRQTDPKCFADVNYQERKLFSKVIQQPGSNLQSLKKEIRESAQCKVSHEALVVLVTVQG